MMVTVNVIAAVLGLLVTLASLAYRRVQGAIPLALVSLAVTAWATCAALNEALRTPDGYPGRWIVNTVWFAAVALASLGLLSVERRLTLGSWRIPRWLKVAAVADLVLILCVTLPSLSFLKFGFVDDDGIWHYTALWAAQGMYVLMLLVFACTGITRRATESSGTRQYLLYGATGSVASGIALQAAQLQVMTLCAAAVVIFLGGVILGTRAIEESATCAGRGGDHAADLELALRDPVTGLIGRAALEFVLDDLAGCDRFALVVVDLDGLKPANDTYGHLVGDECLRATAARIASAVGEFGTVGRFGGDEFVAALPEVSAEHAIAIASAIVNAVHQDLGLPQISLTPTVSVGVASGAKGQEVASVLNDADTAMYDAKRLGGDQFSVAAMTR